MTPACRPGCRSWPPIMASSPPCRSRLRTTKPPAGSANERRRCSTKCERWRLGVAARPRYDPTRRFSELLDQHRQCRAERLRANALTIDREVRVADERDGVRNELRASRRGVCTPGKADGTLRQVNRALQDLGCAAFE